ncbi:MAG TPA: histidine phosphatase family protein [Aeromicrobium sp.]|nr:histidine phosphatase family protein [Aeromicrobium sp.]
MTIWLVRHGATEWSEAGRHTGQTDIPLLPAGELSARALAPVLGQQAFGLVLTSPLQRARRTAILAGFDQAEPEDDLVEWGYGDYEGLTTPEIRETIPDWTVWTHYCPGGETAGEIGIRMDRVIARLRGVEGDSLVFGHGHALRALAARWLGEPVATGRFLRLDTTGYSLLGYEREQAVILGWNIPA